MDLVIEVNIHSHNPNARFRLFLKCGVRYYYLSTAEEEESIYKPSVISLNGTS